MTDITRLRTRHLIATAREGGRIACLTSYDALTARIFDEAGIDLLLVGDSAANVVYGHSSTLPITLDEMISMTRAVVGATRRAFVVADLPFGSYETPERALTTAVRVMKETGAHAVKFEGPRTETISLLVDAGIPVVAHLGFTPQHEHSLGGYVVQGRGDQAQRLRKEAQAVADAGAFAVVLEMVPAEVARQITEDVDILTIGIGAGNGTNGQILVWTDAFGLTQGKKPSFVREYANLGEILAKAAEGYKADVDKQSFPSSEESFS